MTRTVWIINQYASTPDTGMGGRHYYMARELARQGCRVYLVMAGTHHLLRDTESLDEDFRLDEVDGFTVVRVHVPSYSGAHSKQRVINWFLLSWRIRKLAKVLPHPPDAILASSPSPFIFLGAQALAGRFSARLVFEVRDIWPLTLMRLGGMSPRHPLIRLMQRVEDKAYREADRVVSNLENAVEHMVGRGMDPAKFCWIPNGVSLDEVGCREELAPEIEQRLPKDGFVVGYTGTLGLANAMEYLLDAADILRDYPDITFVLVGEGDGKQALQEQATRRGLDNVHFIGRIPKVQIQTMLNFFDACYIGWLKEDLYHYGIGANKIPEYLYSGKPVIHGYSGGCDPVRKFAAGVSVEAENPQALADGILQLYNAAASERVDMGRRGHDAVLCHYEYGILAGKLQSVLFG